MTIGEFFALLQQTDIIEAKAWLEELKKMIAPKEFETITKIELEKSNLLELSASIAFIIQLRIGGISSEPLYSNIIETGHQFLQEIHRKAVDNGIHVEQDEIDIPLTFTEVMVKRGYVKVAQGMVILTEKGERSAQKIAQQIIGGNNAAKD